ncbi:MULTISPECIES: 30S ribosomal protein S13 [Thermotoga]|uniref:Small ribosomal subunit protein uS13 n=1 Tax=Thermotoga neapolitana (strain ATCC 49049 / DSM 4359 / NBRC 107923 / NS-E) TaxID=309803 RepID=RS13_THENN|nr:MULTISPECIES: 30S ribosomal protein S13 [Thermotoga]B9K8B1.1 RecName: Full=Small ribosomal subunit protein uS13; AltName: Full=30S ribosomal protein S13 [Thermotoga neapolitana DSM 4359]MDK2785740.1 small subunit ribosomal protein [Thermotoga sp.]HBF11527.1 30S ribosomal protein S13 [Thermotoga neapolitana]ACM23194.1 30S ribosomal protein S13 [Thermotoga neapolitana DSM 4359]AJG41107.1 30S ribosomal protein S13 [Thermotoga sp. RQ7]KFZ21697.1 30S ribosomal protein S13 [Thermotoga neapolitan
MARIVGVELPNNKKVWVALTYIYGIGRSRSFEILKNTGVDPDKRVGELTDEEISKITKYIQDHFKVEGELRSEVERNIRRLIEIGCYRGIRHKLGLPVRGQKTRSNARTRKGPRPSRIKTKKKSS